MTTELVSELTNLKKYFKSIGLTEWASIVAEKSDVSRQYVYHMFLGRFFNKKVFDVAMDLATENRDKQQKLIDSIKKVTNNEI